MSCKKHISKLRPEYSSSNFCLIESWWRDAVSIWPCTGRAAEHPLQLTPGTGGDSVRVEPLSKLFRAKMRDELKKAGLYQQIPAAAWQQDWVVHSKSVGHGETATAYLADYLFSVGVSNSRIVNVENDEVTFWYTNQQTKVHVYVTLPVFTFIDRFLQHVLPKGFVRVRYYGFLAPGNRQRLALARELLAADHRAVPQTTTIVGFSLAMSC